MTRDQQLAGLRAQLDKAQKDNAVATTSAVFHHAAHSALAYHQIEKAVNDPKRTKLPTPAEALVATRPLLPQFLARFAELRKADPKSTDRVLFIKAAEDLDKAPAKPTPAPANVVAIPAPPAPAPQSK